ncbi:regulator of secondary metabolism (methyltransferase domain-containing protein) [Colletotrichum plurivorum]|uniref:Regulator of secondary metabolism (Methyltransferase domain-containing protein) n=1 Tax=Colletotrichum plurivorum TaxID=2175906 RepID=A0A8H6NL85_9PEZI|nr:regulator of secondary metabolism (methyltransferase domain-containing protein) [Colletotrichum plurivorum]
MGSNDCYSSGDDGPDFQQNGRTYCGLRGGRYLFPVDESEKERLDIFHALINIAREQRLFNGPLSPTAQVLDVGTGTGIWAIEVAEYDIDSGSAPKQIIGLDLAYIQPASIPATVDFKGYTDVEAPWPVEEQRFDLVHVQMMLGAIRDWPELYRKSFKHLKPGGSIEHVEIEWVPRSDDNTQLPESALVYWSNVFREAMRRWGQPIDIFDAGAELRAAGFTDITEDVIRLPVNPWGESTRERELGTWFNVGLTHGLEALSMAPFTRVEGWKKPDVDGLLDAVKRELCSLRHRAYCRMFVWTAKKPGQ